MALHGNIQINGRTLYEWSAQRQSDDINQVNRYRIHLYDNMGETIAVGGMAHTYSEGAVTLAAKVLQWAADITLSSSQIAQQTST